jgi:hypothetical protein
MPRALWTVTSHTTGKTYRVVPYPGDLTNRRYAVMRKNERNPDYAVGALTKSSDGSCWLTAVVGEQLDARTNIGSALQLIIEAEEGRPTTLAWNPSSVMRQQLETRAKA